MSYGPSVSDMSRRAASFVDKILKGAVPADLPVEQPIKFDLVINLKAAKALTLNVPHALLARDRLGSYLCLWHKADLRECPTNVRFGSEADIPPQGRDFRL